MILQWKYTEQFHYYSVSRHRVSLTQIDIATGESDKYRLCKKRKKRVLL